jgi:hypothetical protein
MGFRRAAVPDTSLTAADSLFQALDNRVVEHKGRTCRLNVCGIHSDSRHRWIQVSLAGLPESLVTIRLGVAENAQAYYTAIIDWLERVGSSDGTIVSYVSPGALPLPDSPKRSLRLER